MNATGSVPGVTTRRELFRARAAEAYARGEDAAGLLNIVPRPLAAVTLCLLIIVAIAAVLVAVLQVEVIGTARGVLSAATQPRAVSAELGGSVAVVHVRSGDRIAQGEPLISLDSSLLGSQLVEAGRLLEVATKHLAWLEGPQGTLHAGELAALSERRRALLQKATAHGRGVALAKSAAKRASALNASGLTSTIDRDVSYERLYRLSEASSEVADQFAQLEGQRLERERLRDAELTHARRQKEEASSRLEGLQVLLRKTMIRAPHDGVVESLHTHVGELVQQAAVVARVVSSETPSGAIVFVDQKDRGFIGLGKHVRLDVEGLPVGEFGKLTGSVERVASYPSSEHEMAQLLGPLVAGDGPRYRVDVRLHRDARFLALSKRLRNGSGVLASVDLRHRPVWSLVANAVVDD